MTQGKGETSTMTSMLMLLHSVTACPELIFSLSYVGGFLKTTSFCDQPNLENTIPNNLLLKINNR